MFGRSKKKYKKSGFRKREIKLVNKPEYQNPYFHRKQDRYILRLLRRPRNIVITFVIGGLIYLFFYSNYFVISQVELTGNQELTYDTVRYEVNKSFIERRFLLFKQNNLFMYDVDEAKQKLWDAFVLDELTITKRFPNKLIIRIKEKIPNLTLVTDKAFYYMDLEGVVTHVVPEAEIRQHFPKVQDMNNRIIKLKEQIISPEIVNAIIILKDTFVTETSIEVDRFIIPETKCGSITSNTSDDANTNTSANINLNTNKSNININKSLNNTNKQNNNGNTNTALDCDLVEAVQDIGVLTTEGWKAYFTINDDIATQLQRLKIYLQRKATNRSERENIDYIDLRFGEKLYVMEK